jgi:tetraacyldisaccharide 4'-kinase
MQLRAPPFWETKNLIALALWPVSLIYGGILYLRAMAYALNLIKSHEVPIPIIFVGNIRVGGTGKTPIVIALAKALHARGFRPGIISRGYLAKNVNPGSCRDSRQVLPINLAQEVGDEPLLIAQQLSSLHIPIWTGQQRSSCAQSLIEHHPGCNILISDDGLQHLALGRNPVRKGGRDIEIVVRDTRGEGNGFLMPAGPLRDFPNRPRDITLNLRNLNENDTVNQLLTPNYFPEEQTGGPIPSSKNIQAISARTNPSFEIQCVQGQAYQLINPKNQQDLREMVNQPVLALAGIAHPEKFFHQLQQIGLLITTHPMPDHFDFSTNPFEQYPVADFPLILITEKDAVKCHNLTDPRIWVVPLTPKIPDPVIAWICQFLPQ